MFTVLIVVLIYCVYFVCFLTREYVYVFFFSFLKSGIFMSADSGASVYTYVYVLECA